MLSGSDRCLASSETPTRIYLANKKYICIYFFYFILCQVYGQRELILVDQPSHRNLISDRWIKPQQFSSLIVENYVFRDCNRQLHQCYHRLTKMFSDIHLQVDRCNRYQRFTKVLSDTHVTGKLTDAIGPRCFPTMTGNSQTLAVNALHNKLEYS